MNTWKKLIPDMVAIVIFAVISFVYFCPAVTEGRILSQHDSVAGIGAGQEAKEYMEKGNLVPDALIAQMIKDVLASTEGDVTMLLDGFPRNVAQAEILEATGAPVKSVVLVDVPDEIIADRIAGRRTCPKCKAGYHVTALPPNVEGVCDKCGELLEFSLEDEEE